MGRKKGENEKKNIRKKNKLTTLKEDGKAEKYSTKTSLSYKEIITKTPQKS